MVKYDEWEEFIMETLSPQLGLNKKETESLIVEVRNAMFGVESGELRIENENRQYWKISFINRKELDEKLPVEISPKPDNFHRVHLLLTPMKEFEEIAQQTLKPLERAGFTVVELGVYYNGK